MKQHLFFPKALCRQTLILAGGMLLFAQCKKEETVIPTWHSKNAAYYFDLDSAGT